MTRWKQSLVLFSAVAAAAPPSWAVAQQAAAQDYRARLPQDELIYFLLPDRFENGDRKNDLGGLKGDRLKTGYDPAHKGYFHGGDLKGLIKRLDYIQGMGVTAVWLAPIFKNKVVQGPPGEESAGYHGYWVTDFTRVDPHFGTNDDFKAFVDAAHARGMKVYMDIIANHTADVIQYKGCPIQACGYRSIGDYPYQRRGGPAGSAINPGFTGDGDRSPENFAKLTNPDFAYEVEIPAAEKSVKKPDWLNDPIWYHNRGNSEWHGESMTYGDFSGLDDLYTEHPRVVAGLIEVFGSWIDRFGVDGFRIDTAKHVNPEFWQAFVPAMLERARAKGIPNFHIFGEVYQDTMEPGTLAVHTRVDRYPTVLDFAFRAAALQTLAGTKGTESWERLFFGDPLYEGGAGKAMQLPTFLSNHDAGRFSMFIRRAFPAAGDEEILDRVALGHVMMLTLRGVPTIYSGDEQGFVSDEGDQAAREDMFASKVAIYNDNDLVGTDATTAVSNFDSNHPLYRLIANLAKVRADTPALRRGRQLVRASGQKPGLFAASRFDPETGKEVLLLFNTSTQPISQNVVVEVGSQRFSALAGQCATEASAPGSLRVSLAGLGYAVCAAE
ncbi:MAG: alpha-amylase family glycosyl hydrolase [Pseudomonadota bacterium]|nr:alpha-amylase family glycosyl hydrolase [Pseudomonadota bacterium]